MFSGCVDKQIILVPQSSYYPTFNTSDFNKSNPYKIQMWINDDNESLCADKDDMSGLIYDTKTLRSNYNILLEKINKFNKRIEKLNEEQRKKKPQEVEKIPTSWFK